MTVNPSGWRPTAPANEQVETQTVTGNRALQLEEPLLFERGRLDQTGVDLPDAKVSGKRLKGLERNRDIGGMEAIFESGIERPILTYSSFSSPRYF